MSPRLALAAFFAASAAAAGPGTPPTCYDANYNVTACTDLNVQYYGGHVIANPKVYAVFWGSGVDATVQSQIGPFYTALTNSAMFDWLLEYDTNVSISAGGSIGGQGTNQYLGRGSYAGAYSITPTINATSSIADGDITAELEAQIVAGHLPAPDANTIYMIHFAPGISIDDGGGYLSCYDWCAYHGTYARPGDNSSVYYAVMPDYTQPDGQGGDCTFGCGDGDPFQNICSASTHELLEATTDAEVGLAQSYDIPLAWYDSESNSQGEIGDMCNQNTDTFTGLDNQTYTVQQVYSQATGLCQTAHSLAHDFAVYMNPNSATVLQGDTASIPITALNVAGDAQTLTLSLDGVPSGVTATLGTSSLASDGTTTLDLSVAPGAPNALDKQIILRADGAGSVTHTAALLLTVGTPVILANDWSIAIAPAAASVAPGGTAAYTLTTHVTSGAAESITLAFSGLPPGVGGLIQPNPVNAGSPATLTLTADAGAANAAPTTFTVTGTSASVPDPGHSATATVAVAVPPTVTLSGVSNGDTVTGTVALSASGAAAAGTTLSSVVIRIGGTQVATGASAPAYSWDTTHTANGSVVVSATATDADGGAATASVTVTVQNAHASPPTVQIDSPLTGASVSGTVTVHASALAGDGSSLQSLTLFIDGTQAATGASSPLIFTWNTAAVANGSHSLLAVATDADGLSAADSSAVIVRALPTVEITAPLDAARVSGPVTVKVTATAPNGTLLEQVALQLDGKEVGAAQEEPYNFSWDSAQVANGIHTLSAVAFASDGSTQSSSVNVTVANDFSISLSPGDASAVIGAAPATYTVTTAGSAGPLTLSVSGLPPGAVAQYSAGQVKAGDPFTLSILAPTGTAAAPPTLFTLTATSSENRAGHSATATVSLVTPPAGGCTSAGAASWEFLAAFGLLLVRRRRV